MATRRTWRRCSRNRSCTRIARLTSSSRTRPRTIIRTPGWSRRGSTTSRTMLSPGEAAVTVMRLCAPGQAGSRAPVRPAADLLHEARARERAARIPEAVASYEAAIAAAELAEEQAVLAEALRRLAVVRHRRGESAEARELCPRSPALARPARHGVAPGGGLTTPR